MNGYLMFGMKSKVVFTGLPRGNGMILIPNG